MAAINLADLEYFLEQYWLLLSLLSVASVVLSIVAVLWVIGLLPADYFQHDRQPQPLLLSQYPLLNLMIVLGKNLLGYCCLLLGVVLLFLPGQGLLMILVGLMLVHFPGKYRLQRSLIMRPGMLNAVNRLRRRMGKALFRV